MGQLIPLIMSSGGYISSAAFRRFGREVLYKSSRAAENNQNITINLGTTDMKIQTRAGGGHNDEEKC